MTNDLGDFPTVTFTTGTAWYDGMDDRIYPDPLDDLAPWIPNEPAPFKTADAAKFAREISTPAPLPGSDVRDRGITVSPEAIRKATDAYGCIFTVELADGGHYTYRVWRAKPRDDRDPPLFGAVLTKTDPTNPWHYTYLGLITENLRLVATTNTKIQDDRFEALAEALQVIGHGDLLVAGMVVGIANSGNCSVCGRMLTNPKSLATGIGPECTKKGEG